MHIDRRLDAKARINATVLSLSAGTGIAVCVAFLVGTLVYPAGYLLFDLKGVAFAYTACGISLAAGLLAGGRMAVEGWRNAYPIELADLVHAPSLDTRSPPAGPKLAPGPTRRSRGRASIRSELQR